MWNHSIPSCFSHPGGSRRGCDPCYGCRGGQKVTRLHCRALQTKCRLVSAGTGEVGQHMRVHMGWSFKCTGYLVHHQYHCFNGSLGVCLIFSDTHAFESWKPPDVGPSQISMCPIQISMGPERTKGLGTCIKIQHKPPNRLLCLFPKSRIPE